MRFIIYAFYLAFILLFSVAGTTSILKYHFEGGQNYKFLREVVGFLASTPMNIKNMYLNRSIDLDLPEKYLTHNNKKKLVRFNENKRNALLVLPRYDHSLKRSVVNIIDLNNWSTIHTYRHDINQMYSKVINTEEFPKLLIDDSPKRFEYRNPLILNNGDLISDSDYAPAFKIDFCSNLQWVNDEEIFHHGKMLDFEGNIWSPGQMNPKSKFVKKWGKSNTQDDSIIKFNTDGEILFSKSLLEIFIENKIVPENFALYNSYILNNTDFFHLNKIEPALDNSLYWNKGDIFLSIPKVSAVVHYRPSTNKIINYIVGPFDTIHDVDIISDSKISIFHNKNYLDGNEYSELLVYNFKTKKFSKKLEKQFKEDKIKTITQGLSQTLKDGSVLIEEQNHGRIILYNNNGEKDWEFVNKDKNDDIGFVSWSRVIEDKLFIEKFKSLVNSKKCLN